MQKIKTEPHAIKTKSRESKRDIDLMKRMEKQFDISFNQLAYLKKHKGLYYKFLVGLYKYRKGLAVERTSGINGKGRKRHQEK